MKRNLLQQAAVLKAVDGAVLAGSTAKVGEVLDFAGYRSAILCVNYAATTSDPSVANVTLTMVEGDTSSPATAVTFNVTPTVINALTAGVLEMHIDLTPFKRYGKFTLTPAYTGGTSPNIYAGATITLGDKNIDPTPSAVTIYKKA